MDFLPDDIAEYAEKYTAEEPALLRELNRYTLANVLQPRMLAGHLQGRVISMLSHMVKPKSVLEIGTYTGYSALCWAEGLAAGGAVHTIDVNDELEPKIRRFLDKSPHKDQVHLHFGDARSLIPEMEGPFDIVFMDADKISYPDYLDMTIDKVPVGGYIIADNVLWSGKVTMPEGDMDPDTSALLAYALKVREDQRLEQVLLPVRDGLLIARKTATQ